MSFWLLPCNVVFVFLKTHCQKGLAFSFVRPGPFMHDASPIPVRMRTQEYVIGHEPAAFYKEFHGGEIMEFDSLARGVDKWEFDIFEWAATVPRPLAILTMVLMNRMGLVITTGRGERRHGSVLVAWETACKYFQVGPGVHPVRPPPREHRGKPHLLIALCVVCVACDGLAIVCMMQYVEDSYYRDIAYHTAIHAADTVHGVHFFISRQVVCMCVCSGVEGYKR
jgi:hypothetical protein